MPIAVKFPIDPATIPNGSQPDFETNEDIVMQGYRRTLAEWLVICGKTYDEWVKLYAEGYGKKQALIYGLPLDCKKLVDRDLLLFCDANPKPEHLPQFYLRRQRIEAWLAKYSKLDDIDRRFWARALLTSGYAAYRLNIPWRPTIQEFFPWTEAIPATIEEKSVFRALARIPLVTGSLETGYWPTPILEKYFAVRVREKGIAIHSWRTKFMHLPVPDDTVLTLSRIAQLLHLHRGTLYRSFREKGIEASGKHTKAEWVLLAIKADSTRTAKRSMMEAHSHGNIRGKQ